MPPPDVPQIVESSYLPRFSRYLRIRRGLPLMTNSVAGAGVVTLPITWNYFRKILVGEEEAGESHVAINGPVARTRPLERKKPRNPVVFRAPRLRLLRG